jgi:hypothetical protein
LVYCSSFWTNIRFVGNPWSNMGTCNIEKINIII